MNYKKLIDDFQNGTLDRSKVKIIMDNDTGYFAVMDEELSEAKTERMIKKLEKTYGKPRGYSDIVDILNAIGVPSGWC